MRAERILLGLPPRHPQRKIVTRNMPRAGILNPRRSRLRFASQNLIRQERAPTQLPHLTHRIEVSCVLHVQALQMDSKGVSPFKVLRRLAKL
jgi:hypothetical protein